MMRKLAIASVAAAMFVSVGGAASATTVLESFDNEPFANGATDVSLESQGFTYAPVKTINGQCFNLLCITEVTGNPQQFPAGVITNITYEDGEFDFLGIYVNFNGNTSPQTNFFNIFVDDATTAAFSLTGTSSVGSAGIATAYEVPNNGPVSELSFGDNFTFDSTGYFLVFETSLFNNVSKISIKSDVEGSLVMDCAYYNLNDDGDIYEGDYSELTSCTPSETPPPIPLPAAGWLLLAGVGGLAAMRRRKQAA